VNEEEERAQRFVERHFPVTARFLAAERGEGPAPAYGPTGVQNDHDDQPAPWVTVHVAYRVSRWELLAALAAGYATANEQQDPDTMTVTEIRTNVESFLADTAARDLDDMVEEVAAKVESGEDQAQMEALRRAMDRAYPVATPAPAPRPASSTVTLDTIDHGPVTFDCPPWCIGHGWQAGQGIGRNDITHNSVEVKATADTYSYGPQNLLRVWMSWAPFVELVPRVVVELDLQGEYEAEEITHLADVLRTAAVRVEKVAAEAIRLRGEAS
jgi:hypothetical protein